MKINQNTIINILDSIYDNAILGIPGTNSVEEFAEEYLRSSNHSPERAISSLIKWQIAKNSTNGFISNLGGALFLPVSLPIELTSSIYIQLRTIAAIAYISGLDPRSDKVKTLCYCCLTGSKLHEIFKQAGIEIGTKVTASLIASISGSTLTAINQAVGFRLITKFGETGVINLGKWVPFVGGAIGGTFEGLFTYHSSNTARKLFYDPNKNFEVKKAS